MCETLYPMGILKGSIGMLPLSRRSANLLRAGEIIPETSFANCETQTAKLVNKMKVNKPISTERLYLENLQSSHAERNYKEWVKDPQVNQFLELRHSIPGEQDLKEFIQRMDLASNNLLLGIFLKSGQHIGNIKLGPIDWRNERAMVGLLIGDQREWGKGYATEAIRTLTDYAFDELKLTSIRAGCYASNVGSYKAFLKAGYREEARMKEYWQTEAGFVDNVLLVCRKDNAVR